VLPSSCLLIVDKSILIAKTSWVCKKQCKAIEPQGREKRYAKGNGRRVRSGKQSRPFIIAGWSPTREGRETPKKRSYLEVLRVNIEIGSFVLFSLIVRARFAVVRFAIRVMAILFRIAVLVSYCTGEDERTEQSGNSSHSNIWVFTSFRRQSMSR
jgi:hypothetical protein